MTEAAEQIEVNAGKRVVLSVNVSDEIARRLLQNSIRCPPLVSGVGTAPSMDIQYRPSCHCGGELSRGVSIKLLGPLVILKLTLFGRLLAA